MQRDWNAQNRQVVAEFRANQGRVGAISPTSHCCFSSPPELDRAGAVLTRSATCVTVTVTSFSARWPARPSIPTGITT
jgi:hypothetical protein